jgi:hypothetical protein
MPLPSLKILERSPERPFYRCFIARELGKFVATTRAETEEDEIDVRGLLGSAFTPGRASALEEAALDPVGAAQSSGIDRDPLSQLGLHRALWFERRDEFGIESLELFPLLVEKNDALSGEAML